MGFLFFPVMPMGLRWAALRAAGAPLSTCTPIIAQGNSLLLCIVAVGLLLFTILNNLSGLNILLQPQKNMKVKSCRLSVA